MSEPEHKPEQPPAGNLSPQMEERVLNNPFTLIHKHCSQTGIQPIEMLGYMLDNLQSMSSLVGMSPNSNVLSEVYSLIQLSGGKEFPRSLLRVLEIKSRVDSWLDTANAKNLRENHNRVAEASTLERKALAEKTLMLIIKDVADYAEKRATESLIYMQERHKAGEIILNEDLRPKDVAPRSDSGESTEEAK